MRLSDLVDTSQRVAQTSRRLEKIALLASLLRRVPPQELEIAVAFLCGAVRQPKLGIGYAAVRAALPDSAVESGTLELSEVDAVFERVARAGGKGSVEEKQRLLRELFERATREEQRFLAAKLDGARVQVHKEGDLVRVYSRRLNEVTPAVPELVEVVRALPARSLILDGEAIALRPDGLPHPFQTTMRRFGRKLDVERLRRDLPLTPFFFDLLYLDGDSLLDEPESRRFAALAGPRPGERGE